MPKYCKLKMDYLRIPYQGRSRSVTLKRNNLMQKMLDEIIADVKRQDLISVNKLY